MDGRRALADLPAFTFFGVIAALLVFFGSVVQAADLVLGIWLTQLAFFLLPAVLFARASNLRPARFLRLTSGLAPGVLALVLLASLANYFFAAGGMALLDRFLPETWLRVETERILVAESGLRLALVLVGVSVLAPLGEEAVFRGYLQRSLMGRLGPWPGIALSALLFSALHIDPIGFLPRLELGLLFGWLMWRTGSLWAPILAHAVNNGLAAALFAFSGEPTEPVSEPAVRSLLALMFMGAVVLVPTLHAIRARTRPTTIDSVSEDEIASPDREVRFRRDGPEGVVVALMLLAAVVIFGVALATGALEQAQLPSPAPAPAAAE